MDSIKMFLTDKAFSKSNMLFGKNCFQEDISVTCKKEDASVSGGVKCKTSQYRYNIDKVELLKKLNHDVSVQKLCDAYSIVSSAVYTIKKLKEKMLKYHSGSDSKKQINIRKTMKEVKCVSKEREQELCWFEDVMANRFHHKRKITNQESISYRLDQLVNIISELQQHQQAGEDVQSSHSQTDSHSEQKANSGNEPCSTDLKMENMETQCLQHAVEESHSDQPLGAIVKERKQENKAAEVYLLEGQVKVHTRSRSSPYPETDLHRFNVPDDKVPWDVDFPEYNPPTYTSPVVLAKSDWADKVDLYNVPVVERKLPFNTFDNAENTKRYSYFGNYRVHNGIPLNPIGRTGLQSRGILGRWGPNHHVDLVITRWKYDENNQKMMKNGKPQFEFVAVRRSDTEPWALPESILVPGHSPTENLKIKFSDEALSLMGEDRIQMKKLKQEMKKILKKGKLIYKGYADDPRNTDNAWVESTVYLYRDKKYVLRLFSIKAAASGLQTTWVIASSELPLHGAHSYFLMLVAEKLNASF
ncbi:hypothetical protein CHS0354_033355 [Potamilus streckersoni]|uniref:ADP-ribose pyrophosphatase, mitochondrial n=1 Tax=Potamilus streckersoni TaxID=2493646 RepID=A0AAE0RTC2_9BIVA|nr:hypothetical protein CHS0354_033355 [Potamilus streckersoni]